MLDTIDSLKQRRNGLGARPNMRYRDMRQATDEYYAEVVRQATGTDEPVPTKLKFRVWYVAASVLGLVALAVGMVMP